MSRLATAAPARKEAIPAKVLLSGPSGSGKTYSGLLAAAELAAPDGKVLVIDTEHRSAALYADLTKFDHIDWHPPYDPRELADTIRDGGTKYDVILIDSTTHFWSNEGGTLTIVDAAGARSRGNTYAGWKEGTPAQQGLYEAILAAPCHVICTVRSKTEYVLETDSRGKQVPRRVGMAPIQRDGIEYEFTVQLDLDHDHNAIVGKTRCPAVADQVYAKGKTKEWATILRDWLNDGAAPPEPVPCPAEGCGHTARTKAEHVPHLQAVHGWQWEGSKLVPPSRLPAHGAPGAGSGEGVEPQPPVAPPSPPPSQAQEGGGAEETEGESDMASTMTSSVNATEQPRPGPSKPAAAAPSARPARTIALMACATQRYPDRQKRLDWAADEIGRHITSFSELTEAEEHTLLDALAQVPA